MAVKLVGALMVTSLIVLPVATTLIVARSYKQTLITTIILGIIYMMTGITASYYYDIKPGGAIIIAALVGMFVFFVYGKIKKR